MVTKRKSKKVRSADGIKDAAHEKARCRRERQVASRELADHAPVRRNDLLPDLTVSYLPVDALRDAERKVRRHDEAQVARIRNSILKFGICQPVLVDGEHRIVHGHGVVEAARGAGLPRVPVIVVDHLTAPERRLLPIALNRLGETGSWDIENLQFELEELIDLGEDVILSGFEEAEIDLILLDDDADAASDDDVLPALAERAVSQSGDVWVLGRHRLLQGDALDADSYRAVFEPGEMARLVLTDEPYNVPNVGHVTSQAHHREFAMAAGEMTHEEFAGFNHAWMIQCLACLVDGGMLATFIDWRSIELVLSCGRNLGLFLLNVVVWNKTNAGQGSLWRSQHELLPVFKKGTAAHVNNVELGRHGRWRSNVWQYAGASSIGSDARDLLDEHPTAKPVALLEDALLDVTERDDIILDPFAGSGSTLIAAENVGRSCRAIEIDGLYCDLVIRRWQRLTGGTALLKETGEPFATVAQRRLDGEAA